MKKNNKLERVPFFFSPFLGYTINDMAQGQKGGHANVPSIEEICHTIKFVLGCHTSLGCFFLILLRLLTVS